MSLKWDPPEKYETIWVGLFCRWKPKANKKNFNLKPVQRLHLIALSGVVSLIPLTTKLEIQMKNQLTGTLTALILATSGSFAVAGSHNGQGQGFSSTVSSTTIEGKSGSIIHMVSEDIWHYQKAPEGWPTAAMATCHYTILMEAGQQAPSSINGVCESVDPDGDASVWLAAIDTSTGMGTGTLTSGTGKYSNTNPKPSFQTTYQIDATHSIYDFKW